MNDLDVVTRTIYGEARGESLAGMLAVAHVIKNRVALRSWMGRTPSEVCLKPAQFSCWFDHNKAVLTTASEDALAMARLAAELVFEKNDPDPTGGAAHYHTKSVAPAWAKGAQPSAIIGNHIFYKGIK